MPVAIFTVKSTIPAEKDAAFNEWYHREHIPDVLRYRGAVSARRYRAVMPEDRFQYLALYEFQDEPTLREFLASDHFAWLKKEFDTHFPDGERQRAAYVQTWP
jgi:hypothetical protein